MVILVTANGVTSSLIPFTLMIEAILSSETSVLTKSNCVTSQKTAFFCKHFDEDDDSDCFATSHNNIQDLNRIN
jgi:hypothetical protein